MRRAWRIGGEAHGERCQLSAPGATEARPRRDRGAKPPPSLSSMAPVGLGTAPASASNSASPARPGFVNIAQNSARSGRAARWFHARGQVAQPPEAMGQQRPEVRGVTVHCHSHVALRVASGRHAACDSRRLTSASASRRRVRPCEAKSLETRALGFRRYRHRRPHRTCTRVARVCCNLVARVCSVLLLVRIRCLYLTSRPDSEV